MSEKTLINVIDKNVKINGIPYRKKDPVNIVLTDGQKLQGVITCLEDDGLCIQMHLLEALLYIPYNFLSSIQHQ
jgi:hypothetical protein